MEADFTYVAHGPSYTPRVKKKGALSAFNMPSSEYPENSITAESFYDLPSSSTGRRDKGKGRAVEEQTGGLTQEESPDLSSPAQPSKERSFYPSSPPSKEVVEADVSEPDLPELVTPLDRNIAEPVNPPLAGRQRIERYTPNISRVVEKAGILSDALEIDEAMRMAEQHFGHGVGNNAPPTPESRQDTPPTRPDGQQEDSPTQGKIPADSATDVHVEYPSLDGMLSPPPSQEAQAAASNKAGKQTPSNNKSKIFSHVRQSISGPSSLASSSTPKSALKMATTTTTTTTEMSWQSTAKSQISHGPSVHFNDEEQESSEITNSSDLRARDASVDDVEDTIAMDELDDESMADQSFDLRGNLVQEDTQTMIERAAAREAQWQAERDENARRAREVGVFEILSDDDDAEEAPVNESYSRSFQPGERTRLREEEYARERSTVRRRAAEVGAITIDDTTVAPGEDTIANMNNTTAFNDSLARHLDSGNLASSPFRLPERISVSPSPAGSSASRNSTASASSPPVIDLTADSVRAKTRAPRTRTQKWTTDNYRTLAAILKSSGTIPLATKRYSVMMNAAMVPELIEPEVLDLMGLDEEGYMVLDARESAAVERFVERERKVGVKWNKVEVVRRVAGVRICALRARVERMRTEAARSRGMALPR
ncbi:hypothetical protein EDC01DRAFT_651369 [Geopyxis carbonaria]|nr:hypothetical protein EDC01DRAFT_651369 [Geopyxis carbonaria]